jgi:uncharacterized protein (DUF433 family)
MVMTAYAELPIPLWEDEYGAIRIAKTRVTLDVIIAAYQHGDTPHEINKGYPTLTLADIYAVLAFYLNNRERVHAYLRERDVQSDLIYGETEVNRPDKFDLRVRPGKGILH